MDNEKLIQGLKKLTDSGIKNKDIEDAIGLAKNSLSNFLSGRKEFPAKHHERIQEFIDDAERGGQLLPEPDLEEVAPIELIEPKTTIVVSPTGIKEKPSSEKLAKLKLTVEGINKDFGAGSVMVLGSNAVTDVEVISTGSLGLDIALGVGGLPKGRIVEMYGPESSGKTTVAIHLIAEAQRLGGLCAVIDAEHAFDIKYAAALGVNIEELHISQPDYGEQALEIADRLILSGAFSVVVIDSVAALVPKAELEGQMGDSKMGLHARLMSQACRKMTASISRTNTICLFINQIREKIGVVYGSNEFVPGGNALKFFSSVRIEIRRSVSAANSVMNGETKVGNETTAKVIKNKCAPPFRATKFDILYGKGIDYVGEVVDEGVRFGILKKTGSWYTFNDSKIGQGRENAIQLLNDNEELQNEIATLIRKAAFAQ